MLSVCVCVRVCVCIGKIIHGTMCIHKREAQIEYIVYNEETLEEKGGIERKRAMENGVYPVVTEPIYDGHCDSDDCIRIRGGTV